MVRTVSIRYRRLPDREETHVQRLLVDAAHVKITLSEPVVFPAPIRVRGRTVCESGAAIVWFTFPGAWHDVGRFHLADDAFTGYYTNILTPPRFEAEGWSTTDLFLDVWLDASGDVAVLDEDEMREALRHGWIEWPLAKRARAEAALIQELARTGRWPPPVVEEWTLGRARSRAAAVAPEMPRGHG